MNSSDDQTNFVIFLAPSNHFAHHLSRSLEGIPKQASGSTLFPRIHPLLLFRHLAS